MESNPCRDEQEPSRAQEFLAWLLSGRAKHQRIIST
jgi:hypothetical protein